MILNETRDGEAGVTRCRELHKDSLVLMRKRPLRKRAECGASKSKHQTLRGTDCVPPTPQRSGARWCSGATDGLSVAPSEISEAKHTAVVVKPGGSPFGRRTEQRQPFKQVQEQWNHVLRYLGPELNVRVAAPAYSAGAEKDLR